MFRRVIWIVLDSVGIGEMPDAAAYGDAGSDTLGNIALVQSFARVELEVAGMRKMAEEVLSAQFPALSWWALASVVTRVWAT